MITAEAVCTSPGCKARIHGRGLCRIHYDEARYLKTTGQAPEAREAAERERAISIELCMGSVPPWRSPHGTQSMFATADERRAAWEERRDALMSEYLTPPLLPGRRPQAWWEYEAGRPERLVPYPLGDEWRERSVEEQREAVDEHKIEPIEFLASRGELTEGEIDQIRRDAEDAAPRVGTPAERWGSGGVDYVDRRAVKLWERVEGALLGRHGERAGKANGI